MGAGYWNGSHAHDCYQPRLPSLAPDSSPTQAALLDARFLSWFAAQPLAQKIERLQLRMGVEAGPDAVWCGAAEEWAASHNDTRGRPACAVLTVPIAHDDTRSLASKGARHVEGGFALLHAANIRAPLRDSLGDQPICYRQNCSRHRWFRYQPAPNWVLPNDEDGLRQVQACAVGREQAAQCGTRPITSMREEHNLPGAGASPQCDGLHRLYWRSHEY